MKSRILTLLGLALLAAPPLAHTAPPSSPAGDVLAIQVGRAETVSHGTIEHAVILVENGEITVVGQDLEIERGIPVLHRPDWVVVPGFVDCHSRVGMDSSGGSGSEPHVQASDELYARQDVWKDVLEEGVTTLGLYPPGGGIPGQAVAVRPRGSTAEEMILRSGAYLQIYLSSSTSSKKAVRDGFEKVDDYLEKEQKAYEKWEKDEEKKEKSRKDKEKKDDPKYAAEPYEPPAPDEKVVPFMQLREGQLSALVQISKASDWLHLLDVVSGEEFAWDLRVRLRDDIDLHHVVEPIGEAGKRVVVEPRVTLMPHTRRDRNLPADLDRAGAQVAFVPATNHRDWRVDVGRVVGAGMDADAALAAMTLVPAQVLRVDDKVGSIEAGKHANLLFFDGDPFEPTTRLKAVMLEGEFVHESDEVNQ